MGLPVILLRIIPVVLLSSFAVAQSHREIQKTVPLTLDGRLFVDTYKGSVKLDTWDKPEVEIHARIEADDWDERGDEKVRDTEILIDGSSGSVRIKTDYSKVRRRSRGFFGFLDGDTGNLPFVHYRITMPATASLKIKDYKSDLTVNNLESRADLYTYKGTVEVKNLKGGVDLETYKGKCEIEFSDLEESSLETYKGKIAVMIPRGEGFSVDADLGRRVDLDSDFELISRSTRRSRHEERFRGSIHGGGPTVKMKSYKGTFKLLSH